MSTTCTICHTPNTAQNPCKDCRTLTHTTLTWLTTNLADIESVGPNASSDNRSVTMAFPNDLTLGASEDVYVMLPILPVGNDNHFTIRLKCHNSSGDSWKFERTQGGGARPSASQAEHSAPGERLHP